MLVNMVVAAHVQMVISMELVELVAKIVQKWNAMVEKKALVISKMDRGGTQK